MEASKLTLLRSLASELVYEYLDDIDIHGGIYKPILNKYNQTINLFILYSKQLLAQKKDPKAAVQSSLLQSHQ